MYLDKKWNELQNPDKINKSLYPWKAQILSGAFSEDSKDYAMNEYLKDYKKEDKRIGTRSPSDENKHFQIYKSQKLYKERYESWII
jgi:hypothetical protein